MMRTYRNAPVPHGLDWWDGWDACDRYTTKEDKHWMWHEGYKLGLFRYGFMVRDTRWALEELARDGHEFIVCTSRPQEVRQDTLDWVGLFFKGLPILDVVVSNKKKWDVARSDLLIDDRIDNVTDWRGNALLFDRPWNRSLKLGQGWRVRRAMDWKDVVSILREGGD